MRIRCVGGVIHDRDRRLLVIRRLRPPGAGLWSIPGGKVEPGEDDAAALVREIAEETGLQVAVGTLLGTVERPAPDPDVFVIHDYLCTVTGGDEHAGDDAAALRWVDAAALRRLPLVDGLADALASWHALPA